MSNLTTPEPATWFSIPPERALEVAVDGNFSTAAGETLLSAQRLLSRIHPKYPLQRPGGPDPVVVEACIAFANSLYNPAAAPRGRWTPTVEPFTSALPTIEPLISHPFWQQLEVLAAPLPLRHRRLPVATTADLLVRFCNGNDIGIGMVQTGAPDQLNPERVAAEVGAAVALLNDTYNWWPRRAFVLFCSPGKTIVELIDVDSALSCWLDAIHLYRWATALTGGTQL